MLCGSDDFSSWVKLGDDYSASLLARIMTFLVLEPVAELVLYNPLVDSL